MIRKFCLVWMMVLALILSQLSWSQGEYLNEEAWAFLDSANSLFEQAFRDAAQGVTKENAQQYVLSLNQLYSATNGLELALRERQGAFQQAGQTVPLDLSYLVTAISALGSGISALADYYQQLQSPMAMPGVLQNNLRIAQLNSTIYWLALSLYQEKAEP
ncbi:MAG: hypothetical protein KC422_19345 [Trueperaceae bacterium]|nr:hypothetical protein [Trueperaceae bacterium]